MASPSTACKAKSPASRETPDLRDLTREPDHNLVNPTTKLKTPTADRAGLVAKAIHVEEKKVTAIAANKVLYSRLANKDLGTGDVESRAATWAAHYTPNYTVTDQDKEPGGSGSPEGEGAHDDQDQEKCIRNVTVVKKLMSIKISLNLLERIRLRNTHCKLIYKNLQLNIVR